ncbi:MAG: Na+/H+ antiporter subunit E, partial [Pseudomonadota bacterium]
AREAIAVRPNLSPKMVRIPTPSLTAAGRATFANSITLTPGTVSVNLEDDHILIHALTDELADEAAIAEMGARVAAVENKVKGG